MLKKLRFAILALPLLAAWGAEEKTENPPTPAAKPSMKKSGARAATDFSLSNIDSLIDFTIPPGQSVRLVGANDYTGADHVSIGMECPAGNPLTNIQILVWWGMPIANWLFVADVIKASTFVYLNMGGVVVPVYGPFIQVEARNVGTVPVSCHQLTVYAVVH